MGLCASQPFAGFPSASLQPAAQEQTPGKVKVQVPQEASVPFIAFPSPIHWLLHEPTKCFAESHVLVPQLVCVPVAHWFVVIAHVVVLQVFVTSLLVKMLVPLAPQ